MIRYLLLVIPAIVVLCTSPSDAAGLRQLRSEAAENSTRSCQIENGFDYEGNDIANRKGAIYQCCGFCTTTAGCKAWSWSAYNGGTCWLKSKRDNVVSKRGLTSGFVYAEPTCPVLENVEYLGNDIGMVPSRYYGNCCDICRTYTNCKAFSWSNQHGGVCWLKSAKGTATWSRIYHSGSIETTPPPLCKLEQNVDYEDNDIGNVQANVAGECCDICQNRDGCRAFSWSNHNGGTCWLKSGKGKTIPKPGVISSTVVPSCSYIVGVDFVNHDIGNKPGETMESCCAVCAAFPGCKAFSWTDYRGGTCWLKSMKGAMVPTYKVSSGTFA